MNRPVLSIVIPAYREAPILAESLDRIRDVVRNLRVSFEFVVVDDGSPDDTWRVLCGLKQKIPELRAVSLARNFGKEAAICAGLEEARGQAIVVMDGDLQHPPETIVEMFGRWREGYQVVNGVKADRGAESRLYRWGANFFYLLFEKLSRTRLSDSSDFKLLDREVAEAFCRLPERKTFFRGIVSWLGYRQTDVCFRVAPRVGGSTRWSPVKLAALGVGALTSFSSAPLQVVTFFGAMFFLFAVAMGGHTFYIYLTGGAVEGFTTLILLLLFVSALLMISLGIIGQYIARIYEEVKGRPRYLVSNRFDEARRRSEGDTATVTDLSARISEIHRSSREEKISL